MKPIPRNSAPFHAIPRIFNCFLFRNYSAIARNEMAQAEATIARNGIPIGNPKEDNVYVYTNLNNWSPLLCTRFLYFSDPVS